MMKTPRPRRSPLWLLVLLLLGSPLSGTAQRDTLNPLQFGLTDTTPPDACYDILLRCHREAQRQQAPVSYAGIDTLRLTIPPDATSLPLTAQTDFAGVVLLVTNTQAPLTLFTLSQPLLDIAPTPQQIDSVTFDADSPLAHGLHLLVIRDDSAWTHRVGFGYNHYRYDIMVVRDGHGDSRPIMPYANPQSRPHCSYCPVTDDVKRVGNVQLHRTPASTQITRLLSVVAQHNVLIHDILITTPERTTLYGDAAISVSHSTHVTMRDVEVRHTYSQRTQYGYGYALNNVWNFRALRVKGAAHWGVFGSNNVHSAYLDDCDLNRFDIHCYGRDITCHNCRFSKLFNQFSATYGTVLFDSCTFTDFKPYRNAYSYNAMVPVDVVFRHCTFHLRRGKNCIIRFDGIMAQRNPRPELTVRYLPNVVLDDCDLSGRLLMNSWYIYRLGEVSTTDPVVQQREPLLRHVRLHGLRQPRRFSHNNLHVVSP